MRFLILLLLSAGICHASSINLIGRVTDDGGKPFPQTRISVTGKFEDITDDSGAFKISLSSNYIEGERVTLQVAKPDWVINHPVDGEWNLPNVKYQNEQTTTVILVPKGSKKLWTNERIERYIALLSDTIAKLKKEVGTPRPIEFTFYLKEWAGKYGFTPEQVKKAFDEWAESTTGSQGYLQIGLRAFYLKNLSLAEDNLDKAALQSGEKLRLTKLEHFNNWKLAGNAYYADYKFRDALDRYDSAKAAVQIEDYPMEWANIRLHMEVACREIGIRAEGQESRNSLEKAVAFCRECMTVYTRSQLPNYWAMIQNNLGNALDAQGTRTKGKEGNLLLAQAVVAYDSALMIYTRKAMPKDWAETQNNLEGALLHQGMRIAGENGNRLIARAVVVLDSALVVFSREAFPQDWARAQNNLGAALDVQGMRTAGEEGNRLLEKAVVAHRNALEVYTREASPQDWATTQNNLGDALFNLETRTADEEGNLLLAQAIIAFDSALMIYTHKATSQDWATTQNNLGGALVHQGRRTTGEESKRHLSQAVVAFRNALEVKTREELPQDWATTQNNLRAALVDQGKRTAPFSLKTVHKVADTTQTDRKF
jgi:tetratricopeptide (TPR) repeat protein